MMCMHEACMDCPYHEQLQYVGDTRLQALVAYATDPGSVLQRKAVELFASSRLASGLVRSRYPCREPQLIPPFALWWVAMVHGLHRRRGEPATVRACLPTVRSVLDCFAAACDREGLPGPVPGWAFVDWAEGWSWGAPPGAGTGPSAPIAWQYVIALDLAAELEEACGDADLAAVQRSRARRCAAAAAARFLDPGRGIPADDPARSSFSEHTLSLALLSGRLEPSLAATCARALLAGDGLVRATISFSHDLFEAFRPLGRCDRLLARLDLWHGLAARGLRTTIEAGDPGRSDCHAWGAHPPYHLHASVLGVRPAAPGYARVAIEPDLGGLQRAEGVSAHPSTCIAKRDQPTGIRRG